MRHVHLALECCFLHKVGQSGGMVNVEALLFRGILSDEDQIDRGRVDIVKEGQGGETSVSGVKAAVQHDCFPFELEQDT